MNKIIAFVLFLNLFLFSCQDNLVQSSKHVVDRGLWYINQPAIFDWRVEDTLASYNMVLQLSHDVDLPFENIYVKCVTQYPDSSLKEQVVSFDLLDHYGKPNGEISGNTCIAEIPLIMNFKYPQMGFYQIQIIPYSRINPISGIHSLELVINKTK